MHNTESNAGLPPLRCRRCPLSRTFLRRAPAACTGEENCPGLLPKPFSSPHPSVYRQRHRAASPPLPDHRLFRRHSASPPTPANLRRYPPADRRASTPPVQPLHEPRLLLPNGVRPPPPVPSSITPDLRRAPRLRRPSSPPASALSPTPGSPCPTPLIGAQAADMWPRLHCRMPLHHQPHPSPPLASRHAPPPPRRHLLHQATPRHPVTSSSARPRRRSRVHLRRPRPTTRSFLSGHRQPSRRRSSTMHMVPPVAANSRPAVFSFAQPGRATSSSVGYTPSSGDLYSSLAPPWSSAPSSSRPNSAANVVSSARPPDRSHTKPGTSAPATAALRPRAVVLFLRVQLRPQYPTPATSPPPPSSHPTRHACAIPSGELEPPAPELDPELRASHRQHLRCPSSSRHPTPSSTSMNDSGEPLAPRANCMSPSPQCRCPSSPPVAASVPDPSNATVLVPPTTRASAPVLLFIVRHLRRRPAPGSSSPAKPLAPTVPPSPSPSTAPPSTASVAVDCAAVDRRRRLRRRRLSLLPSTAPPSTDAVDCSAVDRPLRRRPSPPPSTVPAAVNRVAVDRRRQLRRRQPSPPFSSPSTAPSSIAPPSTVVDRAAVDRSYRLLLRLRCRRPPSTASVAVDRAARRPSPSTAPPVVRARAAVPCSSPDPRWSG